MSNMDYTSIEVIPRLTACFMNHGYPSCMDIQDVRPPCHYMCALPNFHFSFFFQQVLREMYALDKKIFELYVSHKSECFSGIIEHGMDVGYFDWDQAMEPTKVRSYIRDILMNLVLVHAEVYAVSPQLVPRVMHELVKIMSKEFYDCIAAVEAFNVNGIIYVRVGVYIRLCWVDSGMVFGACRLLLSWLHWRTSSNHTLMLCLERTLISAESIWENGMSLDVTGR